MSRIAVSLVVAALAASCAAPHSIPPSLLVVEIQARGLSAAEVESRLTVPLEDALVQVKSIRTLRSTSTDGAVTFEIEFESSVSEEKRSEVQIVLSKFPVGFGGATSSPQIRTTTAPSPIRKP